MSAIIATVILALLAAFQFALAAGAPLGIFAWGGKNRVLPMSLRIASVASVLIYTVTAVVLLERNAVINLVELPVVERVAAWVVCVYFALGVFLNAASRSKPERFVMTPVAFALTILSLWVATSYHVG